MLIWLIWLILNTLFEIYMTTSFLTVRLTELPAPVNSEQTTPILYVGLHIIQGLVDNMPKTLRTPTTYVACHVPIISLSWTGTLELFLRDTPPIDRAHKATHSDPSCFVHRVFYAWLMCVLFCSTNLCQSVEEKTHNFTWPFSCRLFNNNRLLLTNGRRHPIRRP